MLSSHLLALNYSFIIPCIRYIVKQLNFYFLLLDDYVFIIYKKCIFSQSIIPLGEDLFYMIALKIQLTQSQVIHE